MSLMVDCSVVAVFPSGIVHWAFDSTKLKGQKKLGYEAMKSVC